jgi:A/G-specific adenine glycosylase
VSPTVHIPESAIQHFQLTLLSWYRQCGRAFAWREAGLSDYELFIAEVLLQRTKAENVANYYPRFLATFPNWESLANIDSELLEEYLRPLGLAAQRTPRIKALAAEMVARHGKIPRDRADLESIPLVGQYIANAIEQVIFNQPSPLLDVNMARLLERYFGPRKLADIRYDPYLQELARRVITLSQAKHLNWAILDFAALVCKALRPRCPGCPLNRDCLYFEVEMAHLT